MEEVKVFKIGGNVLDNEKALASFLEDFSMIKSQKVLVHGGGKKATALSQKLGIETKMVNGRRITDEATLEVAVMVYAGLMNKKIVAGLQARNCNAIGLSGADANVIIAKKREVQEVDYGFVGDVEQVNGDVLFQFIESGLCPVLCAITHNSNGLLLNTNADTIAKEVAIALSKKTQVELFYIFEKQGVLADNQNENSVIPKLNRESYKEFAAKGIITDGMIPKLDNAFSALEAGVRMVYIGSPEMVSHPNNLKTEITLS